MDRGEADVGDLVEFFEFLHDVGADSGAADFLFVRAPFFLQPREEAIDLILRDRTLRARQPDAALELCP